MFTSKTKLVTLHMFFTYIICWVNVTLTLNTVITNQNCKTINYLIITIYTVATLTNVNTIYSCHQIYNCKIFRTILLYWSQ